MNLKFLKNADDRTFNKANIMPILNAAVGTGITALAITAMFTSTLFGLLSEDSLKSLGLTKAVLGFTAFTCTSMVTSSIQQIFTNRAIENASKGADATLMQVLPSSAQDNVSVIDLRNGMSRC